MASSFAPGNSAQRQVALKMILTGRHAGHRSALVSSVSGSRRALAASDIVQIYEVGEQNGLPYCSLEFVNAGSLAQFRRHSATSASRHSSSTISPTRCTTRTSAASSIAISAGQYSVATR